MSTFLLETHLEALSAFEPRLIQLLRELVRIPSVNDGDGGAAREIDVARHIESFLAPLGVATRIVESEPGRASLMAEVGLAGAPTMLLMSHSDVVGPGDIDAWTHPPFSGALAEDRVWGRGAIDNKMMAAASLAVLAVLAPVADTLPGRLRVIVAADEEAGGAKGFGHLAREHADWLRADMALCEGGGSTLGRFEQDHPVISVGCGEKGRVEVILRIRAAGGHASTPWGRRNPLVDMARLIARMDRWPFATTCDGPIFAHAAGWVGHEPPCSADMLESLINTIDGIAPGLTRSLKGQSRMSLTPTLASAGERSNVLPGEARLTCDARLLPGQDLAQLEAEIVRMVEGLDGLEFACRPINPPSASPMDDDLLARFALAATLGAGQPVETVPVWCVGATDAHHVRSVGTPVYGFQLLHPELDSSRLGIHCVDESIEAHALLPCARSLLAMAGEVWTRP